MDHKEGLIVGRNAVLQALESGRTIDSVTVAQGQRGGQAGIIIDICRERKIPVKIADQRRLDRLCDGAAHQGVAAFAAAHEYAEMDDIFALAESRNESPFIVVCDSLEDPHNLGAILRSAEAAGVHGVIIPKRNSVTLLHSRKDLGRPFVPNGLMASFKVIGVDIPSNGFSRFLEISILREVCFLILETAKPAFNHDIICPSAFAIHALPNSIISNKFDVFVTGKLASLIRVDD